MSIFRLIRITQIDYITVRPIIFLNFTTFVLIAGILGNGIRIGGVPCGTKWANMSCVLLIHPKIFSRPFSHAVKEVNRYYCSVRQAS